MNRRVLASILSLFLATQPLHSVTVGPVFPYVTSWVGNNFAGNPTWVQTFLADMAVGADGTVYTDTFWDEAGGEATVYRDGQVVTPIEHTHGWGQMGGESVAVNSTYIYVGTGMDSLEGQLKGLIGNTWPPKGTLWFGLTRHPVSDPKAPAPFVGGKGDPGDEGDVSFFSFLVVNAVPVNTSAMLTGLAADDNYLYVSNGYQNEIRVYDANSMVLVSTFPFSRPGKLAPASDGTLWIVQKADATNPAKILHYSRTGTLLSGQITDVVAPRGIAFDNQGRLMVCEAGPRQQILIYNLTGTPTQVATFGANGGIGSGLPGAIAPTKFANPTAVGMDAMGNYYVASDAGLRKTDIRKLSPSGQLLWHLYVLVNDTATAADPLTFGEDVYTATGHLKMDYSKGPGAEASYVGMTLDPVRYPTDPRAARMVTFGPTQVRTFQGRKYLFMTNQYQGFAIFRMEGEIAVPSGVYDILNREWNIPNIAPANPGRFLWRDQNGDGNIQTTEYVNSDTFSDGDVWNSDMDARGDIWQTSEANGLLRLPMAGIDAFGNPMYNLATRIVYSMPAPFTILERVRYIVETDSLYLSGYTAANPKIANEWGGSGREIVRIDNWSTGNRTPKYRIPLPYPDPENYGHIKSWTLSGDYIFAGMLNSQGLNNTPNAHNLYVYSRETGAFVQEMLPGAEVGSKMGWLDITNALTSVTRANGETLVFMAEVYYSKTIMYRVPPSAACDVNGDGSITASDVQIEANQAIGLSPCNRDINQDGSCNVIDVQRVTNGMLNGQCLQTP